MRHLRINNELVLVNQKIEQFNSSIDLNRKINHIFVIDVSGSMSYELNQIRTQLKNKITTLIKENDTLSIIWFSGRKQCGILFDKLPINSLLDLKRVQDSIDKFLKPIGATGFADPLLLAKDILNTIPDSEFTSLIFLTDGYNNDSSWSDVIKNLKAISDKLSTSTFIEYGYYADSKAIAEMAEIAGGEKIMAENFYSYEPTFESKIKNPTLSSKKVLVKLNANPKIPYVFTYLNNELIIYNIGEDGSILIGDNISNLYYFTDIEIGEKTTSSLFEQELYASLYFLSDKLYVDYVEDVLMLLGDKYLCNKYLVSFGKQKLNELKNQIKESIFDVKARYIDGKGEFDLNQTKYTLLDLFDDLSSNDDNKFYPFNENFHYNRIGSKKVQKGEDLDKLKEKLNEASSVDEINEILANSSQKTTYEIVDVTKGYSLSDFVYNNERANLSVRVATDVKVKLPENKFKLTEFNSYIFRTFTLIKDGLLNVTSLPVSLSLETYNKIAQHFPNIDSYVDENTVINLNISDLPIINRKMISDMSAIRLADLEYNLLVNGGDFKVWNYLDKMVNEKTSKSFIEQYGEEITNYLKELGITDFGGYNPSLKTELSGDYYMAPVLKLKFEKLSSLPKAEDVIEKLKKSDALKANEQLLKNAASLYLVETSSNIFKALDEESRKNVLGKWIAEMKLKSKTAKRELMNEISKIKFALILSKKWFKEFKSFEENKLTYKTPSGDLINVTFDYTEEKQDL
jgi:hypothetical protein